jgi:hypothetical protein
MTFNRTWNDARREQGFRSQVDLDAWFRYHDHTEECAECQQPGQAVWTGDGYQPTMNRCATANKLFTDWCAGHDNASR